MYLKLAVSDIENYYYENIERFETKNMKFCVRYFTSMKIEMPQYIHCTIYNEKAFFREADIGS